MGKGSALTARSLGVLDVLDIPGGPLPRGRAQASFPCHRPDEAEPRLGHVSLVPNVE